MRNISRRNAVVPNVPTIAAGVAGAAVITVMAAPLFAGPMYNVRHDFRLNLNSSQVYQGVWAWNNHDLATSTVAPRDEHFGPPPGTLNFTPPNGGVMAVPQATSDGATANALASYQANADGTGFVQIIGSANIIPPNATYALAEGSSQVALRRGTVSRNGTLRWSPNWTYVGVRTGNFSDPVDLSFTDLGTNVLQESRLFDLELHTLGASSSTMANGNVTISGLNGTFTLNQLSPFLTAGTGQMVLDFQNGMVTFSQDSGIYDGLLPPVGASSSNISFHLGNASGEINLDFDFGPANTAGYQASAQFGNSALVDQAGVPEPGMVFLLACTGIVGLVVRHRARDRET